MTKNAILECMRNDPDIIMIDKDSTKTLVSPNTRILRSVSQESAIEIIKRLDELNFSFPK